MNKTMCSRYITQVNVADSIRKPGEVKACCLLVILTLFRTVSLLARLYSIFLDSFFRFGANLI